jgi:ankyrin repeat protein
VKQHLAAGTDVNAKNKYGFTPLHDAAMNNRKEVVELLIDKGADVNAKMEDGDTPLDWAIEINRTETADLLRKHNIAIIL